MSGIINYLSLTLNASIQNPLLLLPLFILEEFGVPFPWILSGLFVYAGYQLSQGNMMVLWMIPVNVTGGLIGSSSLYWMSRLGLLKVLGRFNRFLHRDDSANSKIQAHIKRWGPLSVLIGRMLPIPMPIMTIAAGVFRISYLPFAFFAASSNFLWNVFYISAGMLTGRTHQLLIDNLGKNAALIIILSLLAIAVSVIIFIKLKRRARVASRE